MGYEFKLFRLHRTLDHASCLLISGIWVEDSGMVVVSCGCAGLETLAVNLRGWRGYPWLPLRF